MREESTDEPSNLDGLADSEDLFGFDPPSGLDQKLDRHDDLFDFDEILASENPITDEIDVESVLTELPSELVPLGRKAEPGATQAPRAAISAEPVVLSARLSARSPVAWMLVAFAALNLGLIGFTCQLSNDVRDRVDAATVDLLQATRSMQEKTGEQIERIESTQTPFDSSEAAGSETFRRVEENVAAGDFARARRRLYALLSVSDRLSAETREDVVARAEFHLADILMAQALATEEERP